jgi:epoxyqueuosine reductase
MTDGRQEELRRQLFALGFDDVRFASTTSLVESEPLRQWLKDGMHGEMAWMERTADKRSDPALVLPAVKSLILLGVSYSADQRAALPNANPSRPTWARYALYEDYHDTMKPALVAAGKAIEEIFGASAADYRYYVDTGPVLERAWAAQAGLGFVGKNAMLISRRHGNWLFLAGILTALEFAPDEPVRKNLPLIHADAGSKVGLLCGKCTRCLDACPTDAFAKPGVVDARRCVSYQTIENKGIIPRELRRGIGHRIYGCDVCLEVCPWNRFAQQGRSVLLVARRELADVPLREILSFTPERFAEVFRRTPIKRVKLGGLLRNACIVAGNSGDLSLVPALVALATHELPLVRAHAVWAVFELLGVSAAQEQLRMAREQEQDAAVLAEYAEWDSTAFAGRDTSP